MYAIPAIDLGATHTRKGLILFRTQEGSSLASLRLLLPERSKKLLNPTKPAPQHPKGHLTDLAQTLEKAARGLKDIFRDIPIKERNAIRKTVGICAPGAWLAEGIPYRGTTPNLPDLDGFRLAEEFPKFMGEDWKAFVNNDGVATVLAMAHAVFGQIEKYPQVREALEACPRIAGFIPGTGFGAGAFRVEGRRLIPAPGPQQFFDLVLEEGDGRIKPGVLTPEDLATGEGLLLQALRDETLRTRFRPDELTGDGLAVLTDHREESIREAARGLYRKAGQAVAQAMILTFEGGGSEGASRKAVVSNPPEMEREFWANVQGTRVFILGGWLMSRPARDHAWPTLKDVLRRSGHPIVTVAADEIVGVREMLASDAAGLYGAALLVPPED
ncbi:MAG: ROK family protein [Candidatus Aminicenantes bacterium]|nr:ROK family protein [Candidatus Aminicenantes bacterium]